MIFFSPFRTENKLGHSDGLDPNIVSWLDVEERFSSRIIAFILVMLHLWLRRLRDLWKSKNEKKEMSPLEKLMRGNDFSSVYKLGVL